MTNRKTAIFILCFILATVTSSSVETQFLFWNKNYRLGFHNFKGRPTQSDTAYVKTDERYLTHTLGAISKSIDVKLVNKNGKTTFTIYAGMEPNNSWIKNSNDSITLKHEQGHFDICEIYARLLRKEILKAKTLDEARILWERISNEENREQDRYDSENTFEKGGTTIKWQQSIQERLKAFENYANPIVILPIYK